MSKEISYEIAELRKVVADLTAQLAVVSGQSLTGLGNAAYLNVGASAGTVAIGDDSRFYDARTPLAHTHVLTDLAQSGAVSGQVPMWNGSIWTPAYKGKLISTWYAETTTGVSGTTILPHDDTTPLITEGSRTYQYKRNAA